MSYSKKPARTPDVVDQWLESHGYYRKHTARDSTCLFRAVSEQIFLTQRYHEKVRADCVNYMRSNKCIFQKDVVGPIEDYLDAMSGLNEFGGPLEIVALSKLYHYDVYIFEKTCEPENVTNFGYMNRLLMFHHDRHYDSVFHKTYIQGAAFCQSLVYNILYKSVFKLPDVQYAVSQMLHEALNENRSSTFQPQQNSADKVKKYGCSDTKWNDVEEEADPINTFCVLEDITKCMFHSLDDNKRAPLNNVVSACNDEEKDLDKLNKKSKFKLPRNKLIFLKNASESVAGADNNQPGVADSNNNRNEANITSMIPEFVARLLNLTDFHATDPNVSCVKQMLKGNLTPFPYKVAKALDPEIYRNIEFDTWNEIRRELRYGNWYNGGTNLQVGVKCLVKLSEGQLTWYHCHIQEMPPRDEPCLVFVEELGEKRTVPRDFLQPLPSGQAKPWALPYRHYRNLASTIQNSKLFAFAEYEHKFKKSRMYKSRKVKDINGNNCKDDDHTFLTNSDDLVHFDNNLTEAGNNDMEFEKYTKLHGLTTFQNQENNMDIIAMPVSVILDNAVTSSNENVQQNNMISSDSYASGIAYNSDAQSPNINHQPFGYPYRNPYMWQINHSAQSNVNLTYSNQFQSSSNYLPSSDHDPGSVPIPIHSSRDQVQYVNGSENGQYSQYTQLQQRMIRETNNTPINYCAAKSVLLTGADLPYNDTSTLRYFYNLGIDYFNTSYSANQSNREIEYRNVLSGENIESATFENGHDQLCLDFHNNLVLETPIKDETGNASCTENKPVISKQNNSHRQMGSFDTPTVSQIVTSPNISNTNGNHGAFSSGTNIGAGITNAEIATSNSSSYMMAYTQVPGMYSTMVPCYPIEEGGNLYIAQYMGVPFGVVPPNSPAGDHLVEPPNYPMASSQTVYQQPSQSASFQSHPPAGPGFYQNQIWYPTSPTASLQSVVIPQGVPYNPSSYPTPSVKDNNNST